MAPGKTGEPPSKRQRTAFKEDRYDELKAAQHAQRTGDILSTPALRAAFDAILEPNRVSGADRKRIEASLKNVKVSLDRLKKKKMRIDSPYTRNTLLRTAEGAKCESLFRGDWSEELVVVCAPPVQVNVVGSFLLGFSSGLEADIAVEMPSDIFESRDYLNYRYHDKRMLYLIYLARHFAKTEEDKWCNVSLSAKCLNGDRTKPVLSVSDADHPDVKIYLIPSYARGAFEEKKLSDDRRNIRPVQVPSVVSNREEATPAYNASVLMDSTFVTTLQFLHAATAGVSAFSETVWLLQAWCLRHRLPWRKTVTAAILADIITKGIAPRRASREQLLRCAFNSIRDGILKNLRLGGVLASASFGAALLERCEDSAMSALRAVESRTGAEDPWFGILPYLFSSARGKKVAARPLSTFFDGFIRISPDKDNDLPDDSEVQLVLNKTLVETGRVKRIEKLRSDLYGVLLNSATDIIRKVDICQNEADVDVFKAFWGEKAGLRRFKDGKIVQSLVWEGGLDTLDQMCEYAFEKYFDGVVVHVMVADLEHAAGIHEQDTSSGRAIAAFDELAKTLRSIEGLPLTIRAVHATSAHLRRCGAYPPRPSQSSRFIEPLDIVASFETSGAWPDDPVAISAAKAAFYVALKGALAERGMRSKATISFLEISLAGFVFRLRIRVDKEKALLVEGSENADALVWETEQRVQHQDNIKHLGNPLIGSVARVAKRWLNCHLLLSQMGKRADELVEILVAAVMSRPDLAVRKSVMGYFCQFLHLLSEFPWEACPLTLLLRDREKTGSALQDDEDFEAELSDFLARGQRRFSTRADGQLALTVYSAWSGEHDDAATWFPKQHCPERVIVKRLIATARSALAFIEAQLADTSKATSFRTLFQTPTHEYDGVLALAPEQTPLQVGKLGRFSGRGAAIVGVDSVEMLRAELERRLGKYALFLAERVGRPFIYVVWRPAAFAEVKFSLREAPFRKPIGDEGVLRPCREEIVREIRRIGLGFVVEVRYPKEEASRSNVDGEE